MGLVRRGLMMAKRAVESNHHCMYPSADVRAGLSSFFWLLCSWLWEGGFIGGS